MNKNREENPWISKYKELIASKEVKLTLRNLDFPKLASPEQIKLFFTALEGGSDYSDKCIQFAESINWSTRKLRPALSTIRAVLSAPSWHIIDENKPHHQSSDNFSDR